MDGSQEPVLVQEAEQSQSEVIVAQVEPIDYTQHLEQIALYQTIDIALLCVLIGVLLSTSIIQIFNRYL